MHWMWIDRVIELEPRTRCVAIKNVSLTEDVLHDHFPANGDQPALPVLPNTLVIEGMAQTAGILVGQANEFAEKVILAKLARVTFFDAATPGHTIRYTAHIDRLDRTGASTSGCAELLDPIDGSVRQLATFDLMFSHIDHNRAGQGFPKHNFVFNRRFMDLLSQSGHF